MEKDIEYLHFERNIPVWGDRGSAYLFTLEDDARSAWCLLVHYANNLPVNYVYSYESCEGFFIVYRSIAQPSKIKFSL